MAISFADMPGDILFLIFAISTLADLSRIRGASTRLRAIVDYYLRSSWNTTLSPYFKHPEAFRNLLRDTRSVISGSTVLHFALRNTPFIAGWSPEDLDVYCPLSTGATVIDRLVEEEGCVLVEIVSSRDRGRDLFREYHNGAIACVATLSTPSGKKVDVIISARNAPLLPVTYFWSTMITNYISADTISITYPKLTLHGIGLINPMRSSSSRVLKCIRKYQKRGMLLLDFPDIDDVRHTFYNTTPLHCPHTMRTFADHGCLRIQFNATVVRPPHAVFPIYNPTWKYGGTHCGDGCKAADPGRCLYLVGSIV
ncbi:hypothetical protein BV25DRAFT_1811640 [Artomyces pyxidatus]|uniref:Uncharacterized protein n=1 Tax=Artomyces pyxidatus TaxID=48021 RepID=A0ACB8SMR3_9AGAM|nr:hypothetical protein BV25DRAFT_1811640 [Artomyces pyxidatus]